MAVRAIRLGCNGVMVDASAAPPQENISVTSTVVEMAHSCGVVVEGEDVVWHPVLFCNILH